MLPKTRTPLNCQAASNEKQLGYISGLEVIVKPNSKEQLRGSLLRIYLLSKKAVRRAGEMEYLGIKHT